MGKVCKHCHKPPPPPSFERFRQHYAVMGGYGNHEVKGYKNLSELEQKMGSIMLRIERDVLDLPPVQHISAEVELSPRAMAIYRRLHRQLVVEVEEGKVTASNALVRLLRLSQITGGNLSLDSGGQQTIDTAKQDWLADWFEDIGGEPVVVFCRFQADLAAVALAAKRAGLACLEQSGRARELQAWQAGGGQVLAVQVQAGGEGVDLTRARLCVYYSVGYSLGDYEQSLARLHRPGQGRSVTYYHLAAKGTVDQDVYQALDRRRDVVEAVLEGLRAKETS